MPAIRQLNFVVILLSILGLTSQAGARDTWNNVAPGIDHLHRQTTNINGDPLNIHVLKVDLSHPAVTVGVILAGDGSNTGQYETTSSMALRCRAIAAVNGDYFGWGHGAEGLTVVDGRLINFNSTRSSLVVGRDNIATIGRHGQFEQWMYTAIGGGPKFIDNGLVYWNRDDENHINGEWFPGTQAWDYRHPLTAVGITADGQGIIMAVVDGRAPGFSVGMTPWEMGALLVEMGASDGLRLDGGGSSTFFLEGRVLNSPSDGYERAVADALAVFAEPVSELGLASLWKLDNAAGSTTADSSGNGHHGTVQGSAVWQPTDGRFGGALLFDGIDDNIVIYGYKGVTGGQSRTVAAWIKTFNGGQIISWGKADSPGGRWVLATQGVRTQTITLQVGADAIVGTTGICDGAWHHVAATLEDDGSPNLNEARLYVDGKMESIPLSYDRPLFTFSAEDVHIGVYQPSARYFKGCIDDVAIFDVALSTEQIIRLYNQGGASFLRPCGGVLLDDSFHLDGDIDRNCRVDAFDFVFLANDWLQNGMTLSGDILRDNTVNWLDLSLLAENWTRIIVPPGPR